MKISKEKAIKRIKTNKKVFGLSESFYLCDEWTDITNINMNDIDSYYRVFAIKQI